jgi:hypothetical protein
LTIMIYLEGARSRRSVFRILYKALTEHWHVKFPNYERIEEYIDMIFNFAHVPNKFQPIIPLGEAWFELLHEFLELNQERYLDSRDSHVFLDIHALYKASEVWLIREVETYLSANQQNLAERSHLRFYGHHCSYEILPRFDGVSWSSRRIPYRVDENTREWIEMYNSNDENWLQVVHDFLEMSTINSLRTNTLTEFLENDFFPIIKRLAIEFKTQDVLVAIQKLITRLEEKQLSIEIIIPVKIQLAEWMIAFGEFVAAQKVARTLKPLVTDTHPSSFGTDIYTKLLEFELLACLNNESSFDGFVWLSEWQTRFREMSVMTGRSRSALNMCVQLHQNHAGHYKEWMRVAFQKLASMYLSCYKRLLFEKTICATPEWDDLYLTECQSMITYSWMHTLFSQHKKLFESQELEAFRTYRRSTLLASGIFPLGGELRVVRELLTHYNRRPFKYLESPEVAEMILKFMVSSVHSTQVSDCEWIELAFAYLDLVNTDQYFFGDEHRTATFINFLLEKIDRCFDKHDFQWFEAIHRTIQHSNYIENWLGMKYIFDKFFNTLTEHKITDPINRMNLNRIALENGLFEYDFTLARRLVSELIMLCEQQYAPGSKDLIETKLDLFRILHTRAEYDTAVSLVQNTATGLLSDVNDDNTEYYDFMWKIWSLPYFESDQYWLFKQIPDLKEVRLLLCRKWLEQPLNQREEAYVLTKQMLKWTVALGDPECNLLIRMLHANLESRVSACGDEVKEKYRQYKQYEIRVSKDSNTWFQWFVNYGTEDELQLLIEDISRDLRGPTDVFSESRIIVLIEALQSIDTRFLPHYVCRDKVLEMWMKCAEWLGPHHPQYVLPRR